MTNIELLDLGQKDYLETLELQHSLISKRINNEINDTLILVEHPHVITMGRKANPENILVKDLTIYQVERGGDVTYHGPGQIVGYPIINWNNERDIYKFLRLLEEVLIDTLEEYKINAVRKESEPNEKKGKYTGVWVHDKKIASIGISFKSWISYHGFALNVSTDLSYFYKINPCEFSSSIMTSMQNLLNENIQIDTLKTKIYNHFLKKFKT